MRRLAAVGLLVVLQVPVVASAAPGGSAKKAKKATKRAKGASAPEGVPAPTPLPLSPEKDSVSPEAPSAVAPAEPEPGAREAPPRDAQPPAPEKPPSSVQKPRVASSSELPLVSQTQAAVSHPHRYAFVASGALAVGGLAFGYWAQGETRRAETMATAQEAERVLGGARRSAATANLLYALAAVSLAYGAVMELLPDDAAEKAALTFHF